MMDTWNQTGLQVKRPLLCKEQGRPCCPCETNTCLTSAGSSPSIYPMGIAYHETTLKSLTQVIENLASSAGDTSEGLQESLDSLDNRLAVDYLLATQGGVCAVVNDTCCTYINASGEVELNTQEIYRQARSLHGFKSPNAQTI
ncbi:endogenous retrovirus group V member 2 Env polyprotein-like [Prionailurus iriomotensis]